MPYNKIVLDEITSLGITLQVEADDDGAAARVVGANQTTWPDVGSGDGMNRTGAHASSVPFTWGTGVFANGIGHMQSNGLGEFLTADSFLDDHQDAFSLHVVASSTLDGDFICGNTGVTFYIAREASGPGLGSRPPKIQLSSQLVSGVFPGASGALYAPPGIDAAPSSYNPNEVILSFTMDEGDEFVKGYVNGAYVGTVTLSGASLTSVGKLVLGGPGTAGSIGTPGTGIMSVGALVVANVAHTQEQVKMVTKYLSKYLNLETLLFVHSNSIGRGYGTTAAGNGDFIGSFPAVLNRLLGYTDTPQQKTRLLLINSSVDGARIDQLVTGFPNFALAATASIKNAIYIPAETGNYLDYRLGELDTATQAAEECITKYKQLCDLATAQGMRVFAMPFLDRGTGTGSSDYRLGAKYFNNWLLANWPKFAHGCAIELAKEPTLCARGASALFPDNIHLNDAQARLMAALIHRDLVKMIDSTAAGTTGLRFPRL